MPVVTRSICSPPPLLEIGVHQFPNLVIDNLRMFARINGTAVINLPDVDRIHKQPRQRGFRKWRPVCRMPRFDFQDLVVQPRRMTFSSTAATDR